MDRYWKSWSCWWISRDCLECKCFSRSSFLQTPVCKFNVWCLSFVFQSIEKLYTKLRKGSDGEADIHVHKADVEKDLFKVLSYQAESVCVLPCFLYKSLGGTKETLTRLLDVWMLGTEDSLKDIFPLLRCKISDVMFASSVAIIWWFLICLVYRNHFCRVVYIF